MVKRVHAVGVILENTKGQILVLRRHPQSYEGGTWGLVGGKVELGENKVVAIVREVQEEIGYKIDSTKLRYLKTYKWNHEIPNITFEAFKYADLIKHIHVNLDPDEHTQHLWELPEELYRRKNLMVGLYPLLEDVYQVK